MDDLTEFDAPVFKVLSKNDSGEGDNNQAGPLIPKNLWQFFPPLAIGGLQRQEWLYLPS